MAQRIRFDSEELRAASLGLRIAKTELRKQVYARTRDAIAPRWSSDIGQKIGAYPGPHRLAGRVLQETARVNVGQNGIRLTSATQGRKLSGGMRPNEDWPVVEFGNFARNYKDVKGRRGGTQYNYKRRVLAWTPAYRRKGYIVFPTGKEFARYYIALWVNTVARTLHDAVEGKLK